MKGFRERAVWKMAVLLVITLMAETFIFNFRYWESLGNDEIRDFSVELGSGYRENKDGTYLIGEGDLNIEIKNLEDELRTACIDLRICNRSEDEVKPIKLRQFVTDESHKLFYGLPEREIWEKEKRSSYITYHLYGKCTGLILLPDFSEGQTVSLSIALNPRIPFFFSWERVGIFLLLIAGICLLRPSSKLHSISYIGMEKKEKQTLLVVFFLLHMFLFLNLTSLNPYFQEERGENQKQYQELAQALKEGSFSLLDTPPQALINMDNPYDYDYRTQIMREEGTWYKWDHAYFGGKYYVYFGVVPAALFYLPYYLITGEQLHNRVVIFILSLLFVAGILGVIDRMIQKWFKRTSLAVWFFITELTLMGSGILYMTKRPDLYTVPILSGLVFGILGFWCFLMADKNGKLSCGYLAAGSLLTALVAGCRPQLFVFAVFALILLRDHIPFQKREEMQKGYLILAAVVLPMIAAAGLLMYYNYGRFGNPFDFGANYNLTFNDMRRRGWEWERIPLGIAAYLFWPVKLAIQYPFAEAVYFDSQYMGVTIQEATYGGIYMTHLFAWFGIVPFLFYKQLKRNGKTPWALSAAGLLMAGAVIVADTNMSGILQRYFGDFSTFMMLSAAISVLLLFSHEKISGSVLERMLIWGLVVCLITEIGYQGMVFFLDTGEALRDLRPDLYSHFKYITAFWL